MRETLSFSLADSSLTQSVVSEISQSSLFDVTAHDFVSHPSLFLPPSSSSSSFSSLICLVRLSSLSETKGCVVTNLARGYRVCELRARETVRFVSAGVTSCIAMLRNVGSDNYPG